MASGVKVSKMNFELNPRGNLWFNDETTFGHKLLSKMGWSKGKGLGKNEDGIKENIKISKKECNTGVGWKNDEIPVAVGCLEYENILQNLQKHFKSNQEKSNANDSFEKSLEQRSRTARNHLHYQKFVRVKDLNRYSEKDMKSIFLEKPQKPAREHPSCNPNQTSTFKSQLSVNDYFAMKMQRKKDVVTVPEIPTENNIQKSLQSINETFSKKRKLDAESVFLFADVVTVPEIPTENDIQPLSQSSSKTFSKRRKLVAENPENETNEKEKKRKTKLKKKGFDCHIVSTEHNTDTSSESKKCGKSKNRIKKLKKNKLHDLKSCLKGRTEYDLEGTRNVSFNEQVSYKILDTSLELCEEINDLVDPTMEEVACGTETMIETEDQFKNEILNDESKEIEEDDFRNDEEEREGAGEPSPQCLDLPKSSGSNFNFWLESQRQASKMKLYKEMMKKIKKNKILRSTNLLDIKGYGNWGI